MRAGGEWRRVAASGGEGRRGAARGGERRRESLGLGAKNELAPKKLKAKQQRQPPIYKVPQVRTHAVTHSATHTVTHAAPHGVTLSLLLTAYTL